MRLALAQINAVVGDLEGNRERILAAVSDARSEKADLVLLPELAVTGYPPEDLLLRPAFVRAAEESVREIARSCTGLTALIGTPWFDRDLFNACAVCADGELKTLYRKRYLPNYGVFDEDRYFAPGRELVLLRLGEVLIGPTICEDIWQPGPPATDLALAGAELLVNLSASPYHVGKAEEREEMLVTRARDNSAYLAFCNLVGGQDELLFDGHSVVLDDEGEVLARAPGFEEAMLIVDLDPSEAIGRRLRDVRRRSLAREREDEREPTVVELGPGARGGPEKIGGLIVPFETELEQMRRGLVLGAARLRRQERLRRCRARASPAASTRRSSPPSLSMRSGRSTCTASRCRPATPPRARAPTRGGSRRTSAATFARSRSRTSSTAFHAALGGLEGLAAENLQARIRGTMLMALSNTHGWLVLATGNKSELSVGYSTLYGDLAGGFALIKDVYKTDVFRLVLHLNERAGRELVPASIIERAPSAELRDEQLDSDSLPPYPELDPVLEAYVELDRSRDELVAEGFDAGVVDRALALIDRAEYKRRQAPPGVKLRPKAFGRDRRTPITNRWQG